MYNIPDTSYQLVRYKMPYGKEEEKNKKKTTICTHLHITHNRYHFVRIESNQSVLWMEVQEVQWTKRNNRNERFCFWAVGDIPESNFRAVVHINNNNNNQQKIWIVLQCPIWWRAKRKGSNETMRESVAQKIRFSMLFESANITHSNRVHPLFQTHTHTTKPNKSKKGNKIHQNQMRRTLVLFFSMISFSHHVFNKQIMYKNILSNKKKPRNFLFIFSFWCFNVQRFGSFVISVVL